METTNDSAVGTQETSTGEGANTETTTSSQDLSAVLAKLEEFGNDIASLKRTAKKVTKTEKTDTPSSNQVDNSEFMQKFESLSLQVAGLTKDSEKELARKLQSETNMPIDKLLESKYFKTELEDLRTAEANAAATSGIKGDKSGGGNIKQSAEYWIAKGEYPTHEQVPDRKVRAEIRKSLANKVNGSSQGNFYNS